jgi:hypothetical protein
MKISPDRSTIRLLIIFCGNLVLLYFTNKYLTRWRSEERSINLHAVAAMIAVVPLVLAPAIVFRGAIWQRMAAAVLSIFPVAVFWNAVQVLLKHLL